MYNENNLFHYNYIFIINLFDVLDVNNLLYELEQTYTNFT